MISQPVVSYQNRLILALKYVLAVLLSLIIIVPLITAVLGGFKTNADLQNNPFALPKTVILTNYSEVLFSSSFWQQLSNSTMVTVASALGVVVLAAMPAFVFARIEFRGRELLFNFFTLGLLFPITVAMLPLYITLRSAHLVDSLWGVIIPQVAFGLPGNILILRNFFASVPKELEDASAIDGATTFGFFWRIMLPLVRPALAAVVVLTMVSSWNAFFLPLLVLNDTSIWTLPLGIMQFQGQFGSDWVKILAFISLSLIPTIVFYLFAEKQIVTGLTAGAVKG
ncbi:carbohydrate ABC transporter permease [Chloroflexia bacterium SDU3-3]|nr:carbohydrate ABC transporter permease [Chloroflexia bacterium SDU3-3]